MLLIFCQINEKNRRSFDLRLLESVVVGGGIEPSTRGFSIRCSTD